MIRVNPPAKSIPLLVVLVAALYNKTPPARPRNNIKTPSITPTKLVSVINGWKKPASNAKKTTRYVYLKLVRSFEVLFNIAL